MMSPLYLDVESSHAAGYSTAFDGFRWPISQAIYDSVATAFVDFLESLAASRTLQENKRLDLSLSIVPIANESFSFAGSHMIVDATMDEIRAGVDALGRDNLLICHSTSAYPCEPSELNLRMIETLSKEFDVPIGYSGHETGLSTTLAATVLGACLVERHITLDRAMWGSDQSASVEPQGVAKLVRDIRVVESALGDGVKKVYDSELGVMQKLRRSPTE